MTDPKVDPKQLEKALSEGRAALAREDRKKRKPKESPADRACRDCKFYSGDGTCAGARHRFPPITPGGTFPHVEDYDWCGEWGAA
jgi:hypothetical protein